MIRGKAQASCFDWELLLSAYILHLKLEFNIWKTHISSLPLRGDCVKDHLESQVMYILG